MDRAPNFLILAFFRSAFIFVAKKYKGVFVVEKHENRLKITKMLLKFKFMNMLTMGMLILAKAEIVMTILWQVQTDQ